MALVLKDRVQETTTTTGTGTLTLGGAVTGYQSFSAIGNANTTYYAIYASGGSEWEVGIGTYTASGTTLSRDTVLSSSNSGSLVSFSAGTKNVWCDYPAVKAVYYDLNGNITTNSLFEGFSNVAAAGTTTVLTVSSVPNYVVTGSGGQTYQLPDATTLPNGVNFTFNNNQSSGTIVVKNNSSTTIATIQSGGLVDVSLLNNSIAAGTWDVHNLAPSNVSWSTNTLDYPGSITSATWNGNTVAYNRGGTGQSSAFVAGGIVYGSTTSALAVTSIGTSGQVLTSAGAGTPTWTTPTTGTVTSVTGTAPVVSSGGNTPAISMPAATTSVNGYLTSTDWNTFNNKGSGTVTSVTATAPITSSGGATPNLAMPAATTSVNGYLTSTDWNTFNGKGSGTVTSVAALTLGTTGTDLSSTVATGTTTPVITLQVPTASASNRGALSSTDWSTFNGKQATLVSGTNIKTVSGTSLLGSGDLGLIGATYGGTGVNNGSNTITVAGNLTHAGAFTQSFTASANTAVTLPAGATAASNNLLSSATAVGIVTGTPSSSNYLRGDGTWASVTASSATNLAGGALGSVPYQLLSGTTTFLSGNTTTTPQFLTSTGLAGVATAPTYTGSTGSGNVVLATSPTLVTPALGTPSAINLTNATNLPYAALPTGSVLQVQSGFFNGTTAIAASSFTDTGITVSITPKFSTSKILVLATVQCSGPSNIYFRVNLVRNSTTLAQPSYTGNNPSTSNAYAGDLSINSEVYNVSVNYLDSPATTSATTYKIQGQVGAGTGYINTRADSVGNQISNITVMEIAG